MQTKTEFIAKTRRLAGVFVKASDAFNALAAELNYSGYAEGGLAAEDFQGDDANLTPQDILAFYQTMQALLSPLSVEQKRVIYKIKAPDTQTPYVG